MVMINRATKEITLKIVYYGPGLCGKTTNLEHIYATANPEKKGKLLTVATETDRTLFFDFLPVELGKIRGMKVRVQLCTVPGQVFYDATRRIVLRGSDGVVFVADSQRTMLDADVESLENLKANLKLNNLDSEVIPLVFQYNKRDLTDLLHPEELQNALNWRKVPYFLSVATVGTGVNEALRKIIEQVIRRLHEKEEAMRASTKMQEDQPAEAAPPAEVPLAEAALPAEVPLAEAEPPAQEEQAPTEIPPLPETQEAPARAPDEARAEAPASPPGLEEDAAAKDVSVQVQAENITPDEELEIIDLDAPIPAPPPPVAAPPQPPAPAPAASAVPAREVEITSSLPLLDHVQIQEQPAVEAPTLVPIAAAEEGTPPPEARPPQPAPAAPAPLQAEVQPPAAPAPPPVQSPAPPGPDAQLRDELREVSAALVAFTKALDQLAEQARALRGAVDALQRRAGG